MNKTILISKRQVEYIFSKLSMGSKNSKLLSLDKRLYSYFFFLSWLSCFMWLSFFKTDLLKQIRTPNKIHQKIRIKTSLLSSLLLGNLSGESVGIARSWEMRMIKKRSERQSKYFSFLLLTSPSFLSPVFFLAWRAWALRRSVSLWFPPKKDESGGMIGQRENWIRVIILTTKKQL